MLEEHFEKGLLQHEPDTFPSSNIQIPISSVVVGGDVETDEQTAVSVKIKPSDIMTTE